MASASRYVVTSPKRNMKKQQQQNIHVDLIFNENRQIKNTSITSKNLPIYSYILYINCKTGILFLKPPNFQQTMEQLHVTVTEGQSIFTRRPISET